MPLLVNRYIFSLVPTKAPFFLRPLLKRVFSTLDAQVIEGTLKASLQYVCRPHLEAACTLTLS
jgi:glutathione S-transferase